MMGIDGILYVGKVINEEEEISVLINRVYTPRPKSISKSKEIVNIK